MLKLIKLNLFNYNELIHAYKTPREHQARDLSDTD